MTTLTAKEKKDIFLEILEKYKQKEFGQGGAYEYSHFNAGNYSYTKHGDKVLRKDCFGDITAVSINEYYEELFFMVKNHARSTRFDLFRSASVFFEPKLLFTWSGVKKTTQEYFLRTSEISSLYGCSLEVLIEKKLQQKAQRIEAKRVRALLNKESKPAKAQKAQPAKRRL